MREIKKIDLRAIDATVLLVFLGVMRHRKATLVAQEMGLTQPAVSHALKRLRAIYGDPLFLRRAHGLEPTARAKELEPQIQEIVHSLSSTLAGVEPFDPAHAEHTFRIAAFDFEQTGVIQDMISLVRDTNPNIRVQVFPYYNDDAIAALDRGQVDLAIGYFRDPFDRIEAENAQLLYRDRYVAVGRKDHPILSNDLTLETYARADHLLVSPNGASRSMVDDALSLSELSRTIKVAVPSLLSGISIVERSELIVTLPNRVAQSLNSRFDISFRPLPRQIVGFDIFTVRHDRNQNSPAITWIVDTLKTIAAKT